MVYRLIAWQKPNRGGKGGPAQEVWTLIEWLVGWLIVLDFDTRYQGMRIWVVLVGWFIDGFMDWLIIYRLIVWLIVYGHKPAEGEGGVDPRREPWPMARLCCRFIGWLIDWLAGAWWRWEEWTRTRGTRTAGRSSARRPGAVRLIVYRSVFPRSGAGIRRSRILNILMTSNSNF